ncbi:MULTISPECIES: hypothetical protein [unclassified Gemella]|uniref:hypothetical protein n=1 Tax=unclassified Gemella TaxID=2624949 RepID=UPI0015CFE74A|nr:MULTISPECIES: hypothetical protein [unclassified Gemella]MBF0710815.1 hypothetical protein [Gemella sp. GL1.1]NYS28159.1 hypothetical protein [Gemella sp. GL1]
MVDIAATLGTRWNDDSLHSLLPFKIERSLLKPKGLILSYPQLDSDNGNYLKEQAGDSELIKRQIDDINTCLYGTTDPTEELIKNRDIIGRVDKNTPPTFIWMTLTDVDDTLVRKIILNVSVYDDHFVICFKSGIEMGV